MNVAATLVVVLMVATCSWAQQEGSGCFDGNGKAGRCTSIRNCQLLQQLLQALNAKRAGPDALPFLRRSVCSLENNVALMCCATPTSSVKQESARPTTPGSNLLPSRCGVTGLTDRIVSGVDAPLLAWPWMALLRGRFYREPTSTWFCGGVLISDRYVLTAAHCFKPGRSPALEFVRLGEHNISSNPDCQHGLCKPPPQDIPVEQISLHPQYGSPCRECNDIALLRLSRPVTLHPIYLSPICLPINPVEDMGFSVEKFQGRYAWAAGWGSQVRDSNRPNSATTLQQVLLPINEGTFCSTLRRGYPDSRSTLCAGGEGRDTCAGDSGGPLTLGNIGETRMFVVGITSLGPSVCARRGTQGLYTSVHYYVPWILETLRP